MLKGLTSTFKDGCNNVELTYKEYVKLDNQTIPVKATLKDDCYENGNFIGTFILKEIQFETEATYEFRNKEFEYYKEVDGESIKIGTFISTDITINDTTEIVKVVGMDYGLKTQVEYTSALDYASGEITLKDVWDECCTLSGLESGIEDFANSDFIVDSDQFTGTGAMIRDVFKGIAMSCGSFVKVMNDDKVYLLFNEPTGDIEELEIDGSASVDDVFKIDELTEIDGNTTQETTTGKNLFDKNTITNVSDSTYNDGLITTNQLNGNTNVKPYYPNITLVPNTYYLSMDIRIKSGTGTLNKINDNAIDWTMVSKPTLSNEYQKYVYKHTYSSNTNIRAMLIQFSNSTNAVYEIKNIMISTSSDTTYEEYTGGQPSPNPDYPQPINVVSGRQEVDIVGKNLLRFSNDTNTRRNQFTYITETPELVVCNKNESGSNFYAKYEIYIEQGQKYTLSVEDTSNKIFYGYSDDLWGTAVSGLANQNVSKSVPFKFTASYTGNLVIGFYGNYNYNPLTLTKPMIEKGQTATTFEEYKGQSYEINLGKNLLPNTNTTQVLNNITFTKNDDDSIKMNGTANANTPYRINTLGNELSLPAGTYTISTGNNLTSGITLQGWHSTATNFVTIQSSSNKASFTLTSDVSNVRFQIVIANGTQISNLTIYPMLEKGSQATSYSSYKTPIELCKIGDYQDKIYKENGTWYLHKEIGKVVLNGSETTWARADGNNDYRDFRIPINNIALANTEPIGYIDNMFVAKTSSYWNENAEHLVQMNDKRLSFRIALSRLTDSTRESWIAWLTNNHITTYYVLATPTTTEITDSELISQLNSIELLEGLNNISITSSDLTGKFKLTYYNDELDIIEDYVELEDKRDTHPWTCLRLGMSNIEGENVDYIDEDLVAQYGENWLILNDNPFAYNQEKRQQLIMNIFNQIKAFGYSAFVSKVAFKPYLTSGDIIHFRNREKELVKSIVLRYTHSGEQITLEAPSETSATVNYKYPLGAIDIAKQTQIIVDKEQGQITSLTETTQTIQDDLRENYYTSTQTNELIQTASTGLTNTFSEAGGNNIFRNTGLWFSATTSKNTLFPKTDLYPSEDLFMGNEVAYEFWEGLVKRIKEDKASNMVAMSLQNGYFSQEQLVPNGKYTVSFKYNKPIALATAKVYINDTEYILSETTDTEFIQVIEVSSQHINIRFNCDVNNGCEIYDLMVNAGEVKLAYSQNQNETTTDTVNISKGITITSSDLDVKFKADADGIRTLDNNDVEITKFTDTGMKTKEAIIEGKSQIVGTLWQEVNGQTWITKL